MDRRLGRKGVFVLTACVFVLALVVRLAFQLSFDDRVGIDFTHFPELDQNTFHVTAARIADGDVLLREVYHPYHWWYQRIAPEAEFLSWYPSSRTFHQSPLYAYVIAAVYTLAGGESPQAVLRLQAVLGALVAAIVFLLARRFAGPLAATFGGLFMALYGPAIFYDGVLLRATLITTLAALLLLAIVRVAEDPGRRGSWLGIGLAASLSILAKPNALLFLPVGLAWLVWHLRRRRAVVPSGMWTVLAAGLIVPLAIVGVRNIVVGAPLTSLTTRGPYAFVNGNASGSTGTGWFPVENQEVLLDGQAREILTKTEGQLLPTVMRTVGTHSEDPVGYLKLLGRKVRAFVNAYEYPNNASYPAFRHVVPPLRWLPDMRFLLPLSVIGLLALALRRFKPGMEVDRVSPSIVPLLLFVLVYGAVTVAFFVVARFRLPVVPVLAVLAAFGLDELLRRHRDGELASIGVLVLAGAGALFVAWPMEPEPSRTAGYTAVGDLQYGLGDEKLADEWYERALDPAFSPSSPDRLDVYARLATLRLRRMAGVDEVMGGVREVLGDADLSREDRARAHQILGNVYYHHGEYEPSKAELTEALRFAPDNAEVLASLSVIRYQEKDPWEAARLARRAVELSPRNASAKAVLGEVLLALGEVEEGRRHLREALGLLPGLDPTTAERVDGLLAGDIVPEAP